MCGIPLSILMTMLYGSAHAYAPRHDDAGELRRHRVVLTSRNPSAPERSGAFVVPTASSGSLAGPTEQGAAS